MAAAILGGLVAVALLAVGIVSLRQQDTQPTEPGRWPPDERIAFIKSCVEKCRAAPGVTPDRYPVCDRACACAADEGEKIMTVEEMVAAYRSGTVEKNEKLKRITEAGIACAK